MIQSLFSNTNNIILCYHCPIPVYESEINWAEWFTGIGTIVLAVFTIIIAIAAFRQLQDVGSFIKRYTIASNNNEVLNQVQSAENTIMKQIEFHYKLIEGIGRDKFKIMYQYLIENYTTDTVNYTKDQDGENKRIKAAFKKLYDNHDGVFGNYYKNLYYLIKYIHELPDEKEYKKTYYINLVKAQLSRYEILLLAYDCIWIFDDKPEGEKFMEYASKHDLLSALETDKLIDQSHKDLLKERYNIKFRKPGE